MPTRERSDRAVSVGSAPFSSQASAFSRSIRISAGSVRGL
jgi:hypothetical protein